MPIISYNKIFTIIIIIMVFITLVTPINSRENRCDLFLILHTEQIRKIEKPKGGATVMSFWHAIPAVVVGTTAEMQRMFRTK